MVGPLEESLELVAPTRRTARNALVLLAAAATAAAIIVLPYVASPSPPAVAPIEVQIAEAVVITR